MPPKPDMRAQSVEIKFSSPCSCWIVFFSSFTMKSLILNFWIFWFCGMKKRNHLDQHRTSSSSNFFEDDFYYRMTMYSGLNLICFGDIKEPSHGPSKPGSHEILIRIEFCVWNDAIREYRSNFQKNFIFFSHFFRSPFEISTWTIFFLNDVGLKVENWAWKLTNRPFSLVEPHHLPVALLDSILERIEVQEEIPVQFPSISGASASTATTAHANLAKTAVKKVFHRSCREKFLLLPSNPSLFISEKMRLNKSGSIWCRSALTHKSITSLDGLSGIRNSLNPSAISTRNFPPIPGVSARIRLLAAAEPGNGVWVALSGTGEKWGLNTGWLEPFALTCGLDVVGPYPMFSGAGRLELTSNGPRSSKDREVRSIRRRGTVGAA